jgi:hypothetical protein
VLFQSKHLDNVGLNAILDENYQKGLDYIVKDTIYFFNIVNVKNYINNNNNNHLILLIKFIEKKKLILFLKNRKILNNIK